MIQNNAAHICTRTNKYYHITHVLKTLHWLTVRKGIEFKVLILTHKCLNNVAPPYITGLLEVCDPSWRRVEAIKESLSPASNHMGTGLSPMLCLSNGITYHQLSRVRLHVSSLELTSHV